ncbi:MAG: UvrD-helicase domain-containing protein [Clostridia bacterium]|nr:UvrD-helicase domain-containing protein [Clostridia bacterium]
MKQKNGNLIIAAAGSGKTTEIIKRVKEAIGELYPNKILAVITYTNTAANDIRERLEMEVSITENIFIGTIHSFLINYLIKPYGGVIGLIPSEIIISDYELELNTKANDYYIRKNAIIKRLREKGIINYDQIISLAVKILENEVVKERFCKRISHLFVDEFQDTNNMQFNIFDVLRKCNNTHVVFVGDPEQNIMSFQRKESKASKEKEQIIVSLQKKKVYLVESLNCNYRSSETIVNFINNFHTCVTQIHSNEKITSKNRVCFITSTSVDKIISDFNELCMNKNFCENKPVERFFLAYKNNAFIGYKKSESYKLEQKTSVISITEEYISSLYSVNKLDLCEYFKYERLELRKKCLRIIYLIKTDKTITEAKVISYIEKEFGLANNTISGEKVTKLRISDITSTYIKKIKNVIAMEDKQITYQCDDYKDSFLTIHKSKGLQADAVLVVASNTKELMKWLETNIKNRMKESTDTCRLGYVAFSRAKEFLCIACKEEINEQVVNRLNDLDVFMYKCKKKETVTSGQTNINKDVI